MESNPLGTRADPSVTCFRGHRVAHLNQFLARDKRLFTPTYLPMLSNQKCCKMCTFEKPLPSHDIACFTPPIPRWTHAEPGQFPGVYPSPASPSCPHESLGGTARACLLGVAATYYAELVTALSSYSPIPSHLLNL